jgi:isoleucyl-tRNA synthetase
MKFSNSGQNKNTLSPLEIRKKCKEFANECIEKQKLEFRRWGIFADWENYYKTMDPEYESLQLEIFLKMYLDGNVKKTFY